MLHVVNPTVYSAVLDKRRILYKILAQKGRKMKTLNIAEARNAFSTLVEDIRLGGESVVISRYGHPVAMLVRYDSGGSSEPSAKDWRDELGLRQAAFQLPRDFDEPQDPLFDVFSEAADEGLP